MIDCFVSLQQSDPGAKATYLQAMPNCNLPFHWPRLDKDQLLCLRMLDIPGCLWSGGFKVTNDAFHINIRSVVIFYKILIEILLEMFHSNLM